MNHKIPLLDKKAAEKPIKLPENPYWASLKNFGLDEVVAGIIDAGATTGVNAFLDPELKTSILPFVGPTLEKVGFFPIHLKKARDIYNTMPKDRRQSFGFYFKEGIKDGWSNLRKDLTIHDPIYMLTMWQGLIHMPEVPPGMLSAFAYTTAILIAGAYGVAEDELSFKHKKRLLKKAGFESEKYYESRFHILADTNEEKVLEKMRKEFGLGNERTCKYHDIYIDNHFPTYTGRTVKIRLRDRDTTEYERNKFSMKETHIRSLQVVYTRAREEDNGIDQCRYFPVEKEKLYFFLPNNISSITELPEGNAKSIMKKYTHNYTSDVNFSRTIANNNELAVCSDAVHGKNPYYVLELKTFGNIKMLKQAMRYLMVECPVVSVQTTYGKSDMQF